MTAAASTADAASSIPLRLAVIMPVFGNWADTLDCLGMLADQSSRHFKLYLADDGSPEPAPDAVHACPFVTYLRRPHTGFAATCNAAVDAAADEGCTHVLLLNNDTSFGSGIERVACLSATIPHLAWTVITNLPLLPSPRLLWNALRTGLTADAGGRPARRSPRSD